MYIITRMNLAIIVGINFIKKHSIMRIMKIAIIVISFIK